MVSDDSVPNAIQEALIAGFVQPEQEELLAPYAQRYFAEVAQVWQERTPETAATITTMLYPHWQVSEETVAAADALLAEEDLHPAARRLISEGRDGTLRALRAQARDRG